MNRVRNIKTSFDPLVDNGAAFGAALFRGTPTKSVDVGEVYKHGPQTCKKCKRRNSGARRYRGASTSARSKFQKLMLASATSNDMYGSLNFSLPAIPSENPIEAAVTVAQPTSPSHVAHAHNVNTVHMAMSPAAALSQQPSTPTISSAMPAVSSASLRRKASGSKALAAVQELTATPPLSSSISSTSLVSSTPANLLNTFFKVRSS